jgi:acetyltransferase
MLLQYGPMAMRSEEVARVSMDFMARARIPVLLAWELPPANIPRYLIANHLEAFVEFDRAIRVLSHYAEFSRANRSVASPPAAADFDWSSHVANPSAGMVISEYACHQLLDSAGVPVAAGRLVPTPDAAVAALTEVPLPVAVKGMSQSVTHKFAAGLVRLGLGSPAAVATAASDILARFADLKVKPEGIYVQHMEETGAEVLVSALRDPVFGTMVSVGSGGVLTELLAAVTLRRAPFDSWVAEQSLRRLRLVKYLEKKGALPDLGSLASFLAHFSQLAASAPWKRFVIELNPVKWHDSRVVAVDGLLVIEEP